jgi:hypothetical protein
VCLHWTGSPHAHLAWSALSWAWDELGFLPSPSFDSKAYGALEDNQARAYAFRHVYHTEYVGGILCAVLLCTRAGQEIAPALQPCDNDDLAKRCQRTLSRSRAYWKGQRGESIAPNASNIRGYLRSQDALLLVETRLTESRTAGGRNNPLWREVCSRTELDRREVAEVLFDGLLIHAAREYELATLASTLCDIGRLSMPVTPTAIEATEFLLRQQLPSGAIGAQFLSEVPSGVSRAVEAVSGLIEEALGEVSALLVGPRPLTSGDEAPRLGP